MQIAPRRNPRTLGRFSSVWNSPSKILLLFAFSAKLVAISILFAILVRLVHFQFWSAARGSNYIMTLVRSRITEGSPSGLPRSPSLLSSISLPISLPLYIPFSHSLLPRLSHVLLTIRGESGDEAGMGYRIFTNTVAEAIKANQRDEFISRNENSREFKLNFIEVILR